MASPVFNDLYFKWYNTNENLRMRYPSEIVIGFLSNNFERTGRVLDLGCGSGRHVILAAELGHEAFGLDMSAGGLDFCKKTAEEKKLTVHLRTGLMDNTEYEDRFFDAVICYSAIDANPFEAQKEIIAEVLRILKPDGVFLVCLYGEKDAVSLKCRYSGRKVSERTYILPGGVFHEDATGEVPDYLFHISTQEEIGQLLAPFNKVKQFEIFLPYGNARLQDDAKPSHLLYAIAQK